MLGRGWVCAVCMHEFTIEATACAPLPPHCTPSRALADGKSMTPAHLANPRHARVRSRLDDPDLWLLVHESACVLYEDSTVGYTNACFLGPKPALPSRFIEFVVERGRASAAILPLAHGSPVLIPRVAR